MATALDLLSLLTIARVPVSINAAAFALDISPSEVRAISDDLEDGGSEAWRFSTGAAIRGEIIVVPGAVFATTAQGEVVVIGGR